MKSAYVMLACVLCSACASEDSSGGPASSQKLISGAESSDSRNWPYMTPLQLWPEANALAGDKLILSFPFGYGETQQASNWCWAACVTSVINGLVDHRVLTQEQVVNDLFGGEMPDRGADIQDIANAINSRQFRVPFEHGGRTLVYTIHTTHIIGGVPPWSFFESIADGDHAVIAVLPGHAVVVTGAMNLGTIMQELLVCDPWPRRGMREIPAKEFFNPVSQDRLVGVIVVKLSEAMQ